MSIQAAINQTASSILSSTTQAMGAKYLWQKAKIEDLEGQVSNLKGEKAQLEKDIKVARKEGEHEVLTDWLDAMAVDEEIEAKKLKKMGINAKTYWEAFSKDLVVNKAELAKSQEDNIKFLRENLSNRQLKRLDYKAKQSGLNYDFKGGKA